MYVNTENKRHAMLKTFICHYAAIIYRIRNILRPTAPFLSEAIKILFMNKYIKNTQKPCPFKPRLPLHFIHHVCEKSISNKNSTKGYQPSSTVYSLNVVVVCFTCNKLIMNNKIDCILESFLRKVSLFDVNIHL